MSNLKALDPSHIDHIAFCLVPRDTERFNWLRICTSYVVGSRKQMGRDHVSKEWVPWLSVTVDERYSEHHPQQPSHCDNTTEVSPHGVLIFNGHLLAFLHTYPHHATMVSNNISKRKHDTRFNPHLNKLFQLLVRQINAWHDQNEKSQEPKDSWEWGKKKSKHTDPISKKYGIHDQEKLLLELTFQNPWFPVVRGLSLGNNRGLTICHSLSFGVEETL